MDDLGRPVRHGIGLSYSDIEDVRIEPVVEWFSFESTNRGWCGGDIGIGLPRCRWTYPDRRLTGEQYYQLRSKVEGDSLSGLVFIRTTTQDVSTATYQPEIASYEAMMLWPAEGVELGLYNQWIIPDDGIRFQIVTCYNA